MHGGEIQGARSRGSDFWGVKSGEIHKSGGKLKSHWKWKRNNIKVNGVKGLGLNLEINYDKSYFAETMESSMQGRDWEVFPIFGKIFEIPSLIQMLLGVFPTCRKYNEI